MLKVLLQEARKILSSSVSPWWLLLVLPFLLALPFDQFALDHGRFADNTPAHKAAEFISQRGDFYNATFALVALLFVLGSALKRKNLRALALAILFSCAVAGLTSLAIRITVGRPRPSLGVPDGLYGLVFTKKEVRVPFVKNKVSLTLPDYDYESLPSGHATTAFATAVPALIMMPAIGIPLTVAAVGVSWARFELNRHRLTDLYLGLIFGSVFGIIFGRAAKKTVA